MGAKKPTWVLPDGSTVGQKDLGKVKPTPKPNKPISKPDTFAKKETPEDAAMRKLIKQKYGW